MTNRVLGENAEQVRKGRQRPPINWMVFCAGCAVCRCQASVQAEEKADDSFQDTTRDKHKGGGEEEKQHL